MPKRWALQALIGQPYCFWNCPFPGKQPVVGATVNHLELDVQKFSIAVVWSFALSVSALAEVQPSEETSRVAVEVSEAFLDQLVKEDFAAERAFFSDQLLDMVSLDDWQNTRKKGIEVAGKTQRYSIHEMTYYRDSVLLVAVDFSGPAEFPGTQICGFMLWELPKPGSIGLVRLEQNVVSVDAFRKLPVEEAAQTMANWRCPADMIENVLGISLQ